MPDLGTVAGAAAVAALLGVGALTGASPAAARGAAGQAKSGAKQLGSRAQVRVSDERLGPAEACRCASYRVALSLPTCGLYCHLEQGLAH